MLELIIVSVTLIPINTDTYLSILYIYTVQMCMLHTNQYYREKSYDQSRNKTNLEADLPLTHFSWFSESVIY